MLNIGDKVELILDKDTLLSASYRYLTNHLQNKQVTGIVRYKTQESNNAGVELEFQCNNYGKNGNSLNQGNAYGKGKNNHCVYVKVAKLTKIVETPPTPSFEISVNSIARQREQQKALYFAQNYSVQGNLYSMGIDPVSNWNANDYFEMSRQQGWSIIDYPSRLVRSEPVFTSIDDETPLDTYTLHQLAVDSKQRPIPTGEGIYGAILLKHRRVGQSYWEEQWDKAIAGIKFHQQIEDMIKFYQAPVVQEDAAEFYNNIARGSIKLSIAVQDEEVLLCL